MTGGGNAKRVPGGCADSRRKKRQRYKNYSTTSSRRELGNGARGFLISCTPRHEGQCFRDALILLDSYVDVEALANTKEENEHPAPSTEPAASAAAASTPTSTSHPVNTAAEPVTCDISVEAKTEEIANLEKNAVNAAGVEASLNAELASLKSPAPKLFERLDLSVNGSIFVAVRDIRVDLEGVAERILADARASGQPGCRFCIKIMPIHTSCYASASKVAEAALPIVEARFPSGKATYAIAFKSRFNSGAHRDDYIDAVANALKDRFGDRFTVNLTEPDVVLIVEVLKTSCCIGTFRRYFELAKMNVREAAKPRKEKAVRSKGAQDSVSTETKESTQIDVSEPEVKQVVKQEPVKDEEKSDTKDKEDAISSAVMVNEAPKDEIHVVVDAIHPKLHNIEKEDTDLSPSNNIQGIKEQSTVQLENGDTKATDSSIADPGAASCQVEDKQNEASDMQEKSSNGSLNV